MHSPAAPCVAGGSRRACAGDNAEGLWWHDGLVFLLDSDRATLEWPADDPEDGVTDPVDDPSGHGRPPL
jgi:hypothetical protein